jgi:chromatin segregation and condensation protein Rec8/ScpA/Scc1 (kleisin family)
MESDEAGATGPAAEDTPGTESQEAEVSALDAALRRAEIAEGHAWDAETERDLLVDRLLEAERTDLRTTQLEYRLRVAERRLARLQSHIGDYTWSLTEPLHRFERRFRENSGYQLRRLGSRTTRLTVNVVLRQLIEQLATAIVNRVTGQGRRRP